MAGSTTIPLACNICAKRPDFSDVSHLLTHISSKGHLSSYYKLKVKASADPACRKVIEDYDDWYAEWNLDTLMRERMDQKEKRSGRGGATAASRKGSAGQSRRKKKLQTRKANATARPAHAHSHASRGTPAATTARGGRQPPQQMRQLRDRVLNPRPSNSVRGDPCSRSGTPGSVMSQDGAVNGFYAPPMQSWPPMQYGDFGIKRESLGSSLSDESFELDVGSGFYAPMYKSRAYWNGISDEDGSPTNEDEWEMDETTSDAAKLKGVYWPGMAMFDSATPEMKRKRNQKKDYSVIEQLRATSEWVEPNEMLFDGSGALRKQRLITGNADLDDEESLLSGEATPEPEPQKKRQPRRQRPGHRSVLTQKHVNTGRVLRHRSAHGPGFSSRRSGPYFDGAGSDEDEVLTYDAPLQRPQQRRGFSIHRDNTGPDITFDSPAGPSEGLPSGPPSGYMHAAFRSHYRPASSQMQHTQPAYSSGLGLSTHQRLPSFNFNDPGFSFRPTTAAPSLASPNFASFGGLNSQTLFGGNPWSMQNGQSSFNAYSPQFGFGGQQQQHHAIGNQHSMFPNHTGGNWDVFAGLNQPDNSLPNPSLEHTFPPAVAGNPGNPLFLSSQRETPRDDDEATVSPPPSEREQQLEPFPR
ncbi:hypothetical protein B0A50_05617 [Salinomyces thailandicus]|uniref:Uncharacterized protein n=1 Tax=Salinomyces thailandicus TaxID=706561 RepID=A0A4U0TV52_9PEZI|nr:hypothetical protein B0A50_05617 [Salinomyces thailandica]